jgi:hypothetical protein
MNLIVDFLWVLVTLAAIILLVVGVITVTLIVRNRDQAHQSPATPRSDGTHASSGSPRQRLHDLAVRRVAREITAEEYASARDQILREL